MAKVVACIVARTVSTRLPLKILRTLSPSGFSMVDYLINRLKRVESIDEIFICTSNENVDEILEDVAKRNDINIYRGSPDQVIERMLSVGRLTSADILLRITGDNPFTAIEFIDQQIKMLADNNLDYVRLIDAPLGATAEVISTEALIKCNSMMDPSVSEYLMLYIFEPKHFKCGVLKPFSNDFSGFSVTVDLPPDLERSRKVFEYYSGNELEIATSHIIEIYQKFTLPAAVIKPSGKIKLPYGKEITFDEFKKDMERRTNASYLIKLYE